MGVEQIRVSSAAQQGIFASLPNAFWDTFESAGCGYLKSPLVAAAQLLFGTDICDVEIPLPPASGGGSPLPPASGGGSAMGGLAPTFADVCPQTCNRCPDNAVAAVAINASDPTVSQINPYALLRDPRFSEVASYQAEMLRTLCTDFPRGLISGDARSPGTPNQHAACMSAVC